MPFVRQAIYDELVEGMCADEISIKYRMAYEKQQREYQALQRRMKRWEKKVLELKTYKKATEKKLQETADYMGKQNAVIKKLIKKNKKNKTKIAELEGERDENN